MRRGPSGPLLCSSCSALGRALVRLTPVETALCRTLQRFRYLSLLGEDFSWIVHSPSRLATPGWGANQGACAPRHRLPAAYRKELRVDLTPCRGPSCPDHVGASDGDSQSITVPASAAPRSSSRPNARPPNAHPVASCGSRLAPPVEVTHAGEVRLEHVAGAPSGETMGARRVRAGRRWRGSSRRAGGGAARGQAAIAASAPEVGQLHSTRARPGCSSRCRAAAATFIRPRPERSSSPRPSRRWSCRARSSSGPPRYGFVLRVHLPTPSSMRSPSTPARGATGLTR